jgi:type III pantothenate kinase
VIATGGLAPLFARHSDAIDQVDPDLTIKGLIRLEAANR